jgi:hypothetical protein
MDEFIAFPIPVDGALQPWLAPIFGLMALTAFTVVVWQAVRYLRSDGDDETDPRFDEEPDEPGRHDRLE